jgi:hypothetical protein
VFQAHVHRYERNSAIYQNKTVPSEIDTFNLYKNPNAPVYITSGNAGNTEEYKGCTPTPNDYLIFQAEEYSYGILEVLNRTHLTYLQFGFESEDVIDQWAIVKTREKKKGK